METSDLINLIQLMLKETTTTLGIFFVTFAASVVLGILLAIGRKNRLKIVSMPIGAFLLLMRGTPLILQLMFFYFAPYYVFHATLPRFWAAVLAFSLNYSAYTCEIFHPGRTVRSSFDSRIFENRNIYENNSSAGSQENCATIYERVDDIGKRYFSCTDNRCR